MHNYNKLRSAANAATETPPLKAWDKIEDRLDQRVNLQLKAKRKFTRQLMIVTTIFILVLLSVFIYQETNKRPNQSKSHIANWEILDGNKEQYFDHNKVQLLNTAYMQIDSKTLLERASW